MFMKFSAISISLGAVILLFFNYSLAANYSAIDKSINGESAKQSQQESTEQSQQEKAKVECTNNPHCGTEYPDGFGAVTPEGVIKYREEINNLDNLINEFSHATYNPVIRTDGIMTSSRNTKVPDKYKAEYGDEYARRTHSGIDYLTSPGMPILAPMTGTITVIGQMDTGLSAIYIRSGSPDGTLARVLYINPIEGLVINQKVKAGEVIGYAENIHPYYHDNIPNHVHVDFRDPLGNKFNPFTNEYIDNLAPYGYKMLGDRPNRPNPPVAPVFHGVS